MAQKDASTVACERCQATVVWFADILRHPQYISELRTDFSELRKKNGEEDQSSPIYDGKKHLLETGGKRFVSCYILSLRLTVKILLQL